MPTSCASRATLTLAYAQIILYWPRRKTIAKITYATLYTRFSAPGAPCTGGYPSTVVAVMLSSDVSSISLDNSLYPARHGLDEVATLSLANRPPLPFQTLPQLVNRRRCRPSVHTPFQHRPQLLNGAQVRALRGPRQVGHVVLDEPDARPAACTVTAKIIMYATKRS